jgi:DNA mismatch endonuclease, patch repair protein
MSSVRTKDTSSEKLVRSELHKQGYRFRKHVKGVPGTPDVVFMKKRIAVFIDGDFWHGYRLSAWEHNLQPFWSTKIRANRRRDLRNFRKLRRAGWCVIRIWEHEIENDIRQCVDKITAAVVERTSAGK